MINYKKVTKQEFDNFVGTYPEKLEDDVCRIGEPAQATFNDFSNGKVWPESVVAKIDLWDGSDYHNGMQPEYFIVEGTE